jgi:cell wall-associated NlpC family hydrolase
MTVDIDYYLAKVYSAQPCWELVADVYQREYGAIVVDYKTITRSISEMRRAFNLAIHKSAHGFAQIAAPTEGCVVFLGRKQRMGVHHCGVYIAGKVLHANPGATQHQEMSVICDAFEIVEFWAKP